MPICEAGLLAVHIIASLLRDSYVYVIDGTFYVPQLEPASVPVIAISSSEGEPSPEKASPYQLDAKPLAKRRRL